MDNEMKIVIDTREKCMGFTRINLQHISRADRDCLVLHPDLCSSLSNQLYLGYHSVDMRLVYSLICVANG